MAISDCSALKSAEPTNNYNPKSKENSPKMRNENKENQQANITKNSEKNLSQCKILILKDA